MNINRGEADMMEAVKTPTRAFIGVDVGGTKINNVLWSGQKILCRSAIASTARTSHDFEELILQSVNDIGRRGKAAGYTLAGVVVGCAGLVDQRRGLFLFPTNIPGVHEMALASYLEDKTGLPSYLENDANCALFAEWVNGAAQGCRNVVLLTVGTGVGGAFIIDNHLYVGRHGFAGEVGHVPVVEGGLVCGCKGHGCLETIASGTGIERYARHALKQGMKSSMRLADADSAKTIAEFARKGDPVARRAFRRAARYLGRTVAGLVNTMDPDMIVIGGGVPESGLIMEELKKTAQLRSLPLLFDGVHIVSAKYKNDAGAVGAAMLAQYLVDGRQVYSV